MIMVSECLVGLLTLTMVIIRFQYWSDFGGSV